MSTKITFIGFGKMAEAIWAGVESSKSILSKDVSVQEVLRPWVFGHKPKGGVKFAVDIDPYSFT